MTDAWPPPPPTDGPPPPPPSAPPSSSMGYPAHPGHAQDRGYAPPPGRHPHGHGGPPSGDRRRGVMVGLSAAAVVLVLAVVVAVGLSGDDDDVATGPPAGVTLDDLEAALLTLDDVGDRYSIDTEVEDDTGSDDLDVDASPECLEAVESFDSGGGSEESDDAVSADFVDTAEGTVQHEIQLSGPSGGLAEIRRAYEQCDTMTFDEDGQTGEFHLAVSGVDGVGDDALGLTMSAEMQTMGLDIDFEMYGVMWSRDGVLSTVVGFGGFDDSFVALPTDEDQVRQLAGVADERLEAALAG